MSNKITYIEIFLAQNGNCFYCGKPMGMTRGSTVNNYNLDHFHPKCNGNKLNKNVVLSHPKCNLEKGGREPTKSEEVRFKVLYRKIKERRKKFIEYKKEVGGS